MDKIKKIIDTIRVIAELIGFIKEFIEEYQCGINAVIETIKKIWKENQEEQISLYKPREAKEE